MPYTADQEVTVRFCGELDDDDITIYEELPMEDWYMGGFLTEKMPDSVREQLAKYEQESTPTPKSVWAWRVFTTALIAACVWLCVRNW